MYTDIVGNNCYQVVIGTNKKTILREPHIYRDQRRHYARFKVVVGINELEKDSFLRFANTDLHGQLLKLNKYYFKTNKLSKFFQFLIELVNRGPLSQITLLITSKILGGSNMLHDFFSLFSFSFFHFLTIMDGSR